MRRWSTRILVGITAAVTLTAGGLPISYAQAEASGPSLVSDAADYAPGALVTLTGAGWPAGDAVHVAVDDSDGQSWHYDAYPTADDAGSFDVQFSLPEWFVANYTAVATDAAGLKATHTFTDGNVQGSVLAGTTQVAEPLQVTKYMGSSSCSGRFKTQQVTTSATGNTNLIGVGGGATNPQSAGVRAPSQIVVSGHLWAFDHWTVSPQKATAFDTTANPVCMTASPGSTGLVAHYTDQGPTGQQQQTITFAEIPNKTFGDADFQIAPTASSGLTVSVTATGSCTLSSATSPATVHITGAGSCQIVATQLGNASWLAADPVEQDFDIAPSSSGVTVTVTCPTTAQTFTGSAIEPCTAEAVVDGVSHDVTSSIVYGNNLHVGTATADASYSDANHALATGGSTFTIAPQPVSVTASGSQTYGGTPTFSASYTLPPGVGITGALTCTKVSPNTTITSALTAGSYTLLATTCSGLQLDDTDYTVSYVGGAFDVAKAVITATVTGGHTYGGTPSFQQTNDATGGITVSGTPSCSTTTSADLIDSTLDQGTYTIDGASCGGLTPSDATNYRIFYSGGSYVVTKAQVLVTVTGGQTYGGTGKSFTGTPPATMPSNVSYAQSTLACTKLSGNVTIDGTLHVTGSPYTIDPTSCSGDSLTGTNAANYEIAHAGSSFTVSPLSVDVAVSGTQVYGSSPVYTPDYSDTGFVNGDTELTSIGGSLSCLPSSTTTGVGSHAITSCSGLTSDDYDIHYTLGSLVVSPKQITADVSGTQVYGSTATWSATYAAGSFVSPDTSGVVTGTLACSPVDATLHVSGSPYAISNCGGLSASNYAISYNPGQLTVTPKAITVGVTGTQVYGGAPSFSPDFTNTAFANSDDYSVVDGSLTCSTSATGASGVGSSYTISSCSGLSADDYTIGYSYGNLTVTPKPITVAVSGTRVYGGSPSYTPNYTNTAFENGDTAESVVTGSLSCTTDSTTTSTVGTGYHVTSCSGLSAPNYTIGYSDAGFEVTPAPLTVTADPQSITYGDPLPSPYTYAITGYVNGQNSGALTTLPTCSAAGVTTSTGAGSYPISCSGGAATNYSFNYVPNNLTIGLKGAVLAYSGNLFWSTGSATNTTAPVTLQATLTPGSGGNPDLTKGAPVLFKLYKSTNMTQQSTDATCLTYTMSSGGVATCNLNLGIDNWTVVASIAGNQFFSAADSDPVVITVYQPATDKFATGGGWVTDPSGSAANQHGNFGFTVRFNKNGSPTGQSVYVYRGADGYNYVIKSNSWNGGGITFPASNTVSFSAKANVTVIDRSTGLAVPGLGGGNYTFKVDSTDNGAPGSTDKYAITVYAPNGVLYHQAGTTGSQLVLGGGNVTVHSTAGK